MNKFLDQADQLLLGDPNGTLAIVEKILPHIHPEKQPKAYIRAHILAGRSASLLGNSDQILRWAEPVRAAAESLKDPQLLVKLYANLGEGHEFSGDAALAEKHYLMALAEAEKAKDDWLIAYALDALGWMYNRKMEEKQAMEALQRAYKLMKALPPDDLYYDLLNNLGNLYGNKVIGRETESLKLLYEAQEYFQKQGKLFYSSVILYNLGLALKVSNPRAALKTFQDALHNSETINDQSSIAYCRYGMGMSYSLLEDFKQADEELRKASLGFVATNNMMMDTEVQKQLLVNYTASEQWQNALKILPNAEAAIRKHGGAADLIGLLEQKIMVMKALDRKDEELKTYREFGDLTHDFQIRQDRETINKFTAEFDLERKEHEKEILANQNKLQSLELEKADRTRNLLIGAAFLSLCIMILAVRSSLKDREIKAQKLQMQQILDSIQEGILRFGSDLRIEKGYSQHLLKLLNRFDDLSGQTMVGVLLEASELGQDEKSQIREVLNAILDESRLSWDLNANHLPSELLIQNRNLGLIWEPLFDGHDRLRKIQLILRDVTESRKLAERVAEEQARTGAFRSQLQQLLSHDFKQALNFLREIHNSLYSKNILDPAAKNEMMRELHTIKGNARTLGLKSLADCTHRLETAMGLENSGLQVAAATEFRVELSNWNSLIQTLDLSSGREASHLLDVLLDIIPDIQSLLQAEHLGLEEFLIRDSYQAWDVSTLARMRIVLLHGLTNALDHGYILPMQRGETVPLARLSVEVQPEGDLLQITIRDYGKGLDWQQIRAIATAKNFQPRAGRPWSDVLFGAGTSTARQVSTTSGRGVGLSVIAHTCEQWQGQVTLLDNDLGQGTKLVLSIPRPRAALSA